MSKHDIRGGVTGIGREELCVADVKAEEEEASVQSAGSRLIARKRFAALTTPPLT